MSRAAWVGLGLLVVLFLVILSALRSSPETVHQPQTPVQTAKSTPERKLTPGEIRARQQRNGARSSIENALLRAGYDVRVGFLVGPDGDNSHLYIMGAAVTRTFVVNLLGPGFRQSLQRDGIKQVTFMGNSMGDWIAEYDSRVDKLTWK